MSNRTFVAYELQDNHAMINKRYLKGTELTTWMCSVVGQLNRVLVICGDTAQVDIYESNKVTWNLLK